MIPDSHFSNAVVKNHLPAADKYLNKLNVYNIIRLNKETVLTGLYGVRKKFTTLLLHVDDKAAFLAILNENIRNGGSAVT